MPLVLKNVDPSTVPTPPSGHTTQFTDLSGVARQKDSSGNVTAVGGGDTSTPISVLQVATYSALPSTPTGLYLVLADETKGGAPTFYLFTTAHRYWFAMVQDA
jgi:hypothetical protein